MIVIGAGKQLVLRNVAIVHAESLPACLQLGPGARLLAESKDKVTVVHGSDPDMPEDLQVKFQGPTGRTLLSCVVAQPGCMKLLAVRKLYLSEAYRLRSPF